MSFDIVLQKNSSPTNKVSKDLTTVATVTGVLRDGTSIIDPTILIEQSTQANIISAANYAYISELGRYYYITQPASYVNGLWMITLHVDVLMTYANQIRAQNAVVARQEFIYNMYLDDGWFMAYQDPIVQTKYLSATAPFEAEEYVLVLAGS